MSYDIIWYRYRYSFRFLFDSVQFIYIYIYKSLLYHIVSYYIYCTWFVQFVHANCWFPVLRQDSPSWAVIPLASRWNWTMAKSRRWDGAVAPWSKKFMVSSWLVPVETVETGWEIPGNGLNGPLERRWRRRIRKRPEYVRGFQMGFPKARTRKGKIWNAQGRHGLPEPPSMHKV